MNKAGKGGMSALWAIVFLGALLVGGIFWVGFTQQSAVSDEATQKQVEVATSALKKDVAATVRFRAYDQESAANSQVATSVSVEEWSDGAYGKGDLNLIADGSSLSATDSTSVPTTTGRWLKACAFNTSTYYGECKTFEVEKETDNRELKVYAVTPSMELSCYDDGLIKGTAGENGNAVGAISGSCNVTIGASQTLSLDYLKINLNRSDSAFNFKAVGINVTSGTNFNSVKMDGSGIVESGSSATTSGVATFSAYNTKIQRFKNDVEYVFAVPAPIMMHEFDVLKTPPIQFEASSTNPLENGTFVIIDESFYKSVTGATRNQIASGMEDDQATNADVGTRDFRLPLIVS